MLPMGNFAGPFASWLGLKLRTKFSYHIDTKKFNKQMWENLWLAIKYYWNIQDDKAKKLVIRNAKKNCTDWRSKLVRVYVNTNTRPFEKYGILTLIRQRGVNSLRRRLPLRFGKKSEKISANSPSVEKIGDYRARLYATSRAKFNKETHLYEVNDINEKINDLGRADREMKKDGTYYEGRTDPLVRCFGPDRGGRSRTVSYVIGPTQVHGGLYKCGREQTHSEVHTTETRCHEMVHLNKNKKMMDANMSVRGPSCAPGGLEEDYPDIEVISMCDLLSPYDLTKQTTIVKRQACPTSDGRLHTKLIEGGYLKVQVDTVIPCYENLEVPLETRDDEFFYMADTCNSFIQWPRRFLKIVNAEAPHKSPTASRNPLSHEALGYMPMYCIFP